MALLHSILVKFKYNIFLPFEGWKEDEWRGHTKAEVDQAVRRCRALTQDIQIRQAAVDAVLRTGERLQDATPTPGAKPALPPKHKPGPTPPPKPSQLSPTRVTKPSAASQSGPPQQQTTPTQSQTVEFASLHQARDMPT